MNILQLLYHYQFNQHLFEIVCNSQQTNALSLCRVYTSTCSGFQTSYQLLQIWENYLWLWAARQFLWWLLHAGQTVSQNTQLSALFLCLLTSSTEPLWLECTIVCYPSSWPIDFHGRVEHLLAQTGQELLEEQQEQSSASEAFPCCEPCWHCGKLFKCHVVLTFPRSHANVAE